MRLDTGQPLVGREATGAYRIPLAEFLAEPGWSVSVVNPAGLQAFAKTEMSRAKTDKADAKRIARFAQQKNPARWPPPPPNIRALPARRRRVEHRLEMRQRERNRLDTANPAMADSINAILESIEQAMKATHERLRQPIDHDSERRQGRNLLASIPGVGGATSVPRLVALSDHDGFRSAKQAVAHAGLDPRIRQSGQWAGQTHRSKAADPLLRKALYLAALTAWRHNPIVRPFGERLKAHGKNGKVIAGAARRQLVHIAFAVLRSGKPFDPNFALA